MRNARLLERDREDELIAARAGVEKLEQRQPDIERDHQAAMRKVEQLADAVIRSELPAGFLEEVAAMHAAYIGKRVLLRMLLRDNLLDEMGKRAALEVLRKELPPAWGQPEFRSWGEHPVAKEWAAMRLALCTDADAPVELLV
jgi:hypothetical protein